MLNERTRKPQTGAHVYAGQLHAVNEFVCPPIDLTYRKGRLAFPRIAMAASFHIMGLQVISVDQMVQQVATSVRGIILARTWPFELLPG